MFARLWFKYFKRQPEQSGKQKHHQCTKQIHRQSQIQSDNKLIKERLDRNAKSQAQCDELKNDKKQLQTELRNAAQRLKQMDSNDAPTGTTPKSTVIHKIVSNEEEQSLLTNGQNDDNDQVQNENVEQTNPKREVIGDIISIEILCESGKLRRKVDFQNGEQSESIESRKGQSAQIPPRRHTRYSANNLGRESFRRPPNFYDRWFAAPEMQRNTQYSDPNPGRHTVRIPRRFRRNR